MTTADRILKAVHMAIDQERDRLNAGPLARVTFEVIMEQGRCVVIPVLSGKRIEV